MYYVLDIGNIGKSIGIAINTKIIYLSNICEVQRALYMAEESREGSFLEIMPLFMVIGFSKKCPAASCRGSRRRFFSTQ